jgi:hypothetical protein
VINKMKTLWGLLVVVAVAMLFVLGITNVSNDVVSKYDLSSDSDSLLISINPVAEDYYNSVYDNLSSDNINIDTEPDLNGISEYFQEFKTFQNKYDQLKGALNTVYKLPDWFLFVVPFVDSDDLGVFIHIYRALVFAVLIIVFIKVLRTGVID